MKTKRLWILGIGLCLLLLLSSGCGAEQKETSISGETDGKTVASEENDQMYITLYMYNADTENSSSDLSEGENDEADPTTTMVAAILADDLSVETIVSEYNQIVVQSLCNGTFQVNDVRMEKSKVWIDFDSKSVNQLTIEEGTEGMLFYNLARSIAVNVSEVDEIYLTMDHGQDFRLGHLWFEASRPFYSGVLPRETEEDAVGSIE